MSSLCLAAILPALSVHASEDLAIIGTPTTTPANAVGGGQLTVTYVVKNIGDQPAVASKTRLQIFTPVGTQYSVQDYPIAAVAVGEQRTESHTITLRTDSWTGVWEASIRLDTEFVLNETTTANNASPRAPFGLTATLPDLTFAYGQESVYLDYVPYVSPAAYGGTVRIVFDIKNDSLADAPATRTRVEIRNRSNNVHVQDYVITPPIPAGLSVPFTYVSTLPETGTAGSWSVFLVLDDFSNIAEASEFNNTIPSCFFRVEAAGTVLPPSPAEVGLVNPRREGNQFVFELVGLPGSPVTIQTSPDLKTWSTFATPMIANGVNRHTTSFLPGSHYFRIR